MLANKLKINDGKIEFLLIGSKKQLNKVAIDSIRLDELEIQPATSVKNLGASYRFIKKSQTTLLCRRSE